MTNHIKIPDSKIRGDRPRTGLGLPGNLPGGSGGISSTGGGISGQGKGESIQIDTSNILFILSGAFVGLDKVVMDRVAKGSIGFGASISSKEPKAKGSFFTANTVQNPLSMVKWAKL